VLGPRQSGKSNFLLALARGTEIYSPGQFDIVAFAMRRGPLAALGSDGPIKVLTAPDAMLAELQRLNALPAGEHERRTMILIDDLGAALEPGKEAIATQLNLLAPKLAAWPQVFLAAAGMREEIQTQMGSNIVRILKQARTGLVFSKDTMDGDWVGLTINLAMRKYPMPPGRAFFASKGAGTLVQTFLAQ
jgi:hypothetical protein